MPTISPDSQDLADITRAEQDVVPACSVISLKARTRLEISDDGQDPVGFAPSMSTGKKFCIT